MSRWLVEHILLKIKPDFAQQNRSSLQQIYVTDQVSDLQTEYLVQKTKIALLILMGSLVLAGILFVQNLVYPEEIIHTLQRPKEGEESKKYKLDVRIGEEEEQVVVTVPEQQESRKEIYKKIEQAYEKLKTVILSDNTSLEEVSTPLNLVNEVGNSGVEVIWEMEDLDYIDYDGTILKETIAPEGELTEITARLKYAGEEVAYVFPIRLVAKKKTDQELLGEEIQKLVDKQNLPDSQTIELPKEIGSQEVEFVQKNHSSAGVILCLGVIGSLGIFFLWDKKLEEKVQERKEQMLLDYAGIVSKLALLNQAGLTISGAWDRILEDYEKEKGSIGMRYAYEEMRLVQNKRKSGESEAHLYEEFGERCRLPCYLKLGSLLGQNIQKGTKGLSDLLNAEVREAFEERKAIARKKGEQAGTKLLIPMVILLMIVMVIVVVPAFLTMSI